MQPIQPEAVWEGVLQKDSMWCYADQGSYKMRLREIYKDYNRFKSQAKKLNKWVRKNFTAEQQYKKTCDVVSIYAGDIGGDWLNEIEDIIKEYE